MRNSFGIVLAAGSLLLGLSAYVSAPSAADDSRQVQQECFGAESSRRIEACTQLLQTPLPPAERSYAYAMRALSYSLQGLYEQAIPDYDSAIAISPDFAVALNNRAWAYFKSGQVDKAEPDVARALELSPRSPHALDTRAHLRQYRGDVSGAMQDYTAAMQYGGTRMVRLYQCGLQAHGLFDGPLSGLMSENLRGALETCVKNPQCDPLPADEECRKLTS